MSPCGSQQFRSERADELAVHLAKYRRILLMGEMGVGKSTLALKLLSFLTSRTGRCLLLELDPGTPPFGIPGTVSLASEGVNRLIRQDYHALCTLDAARFRLPLILAARRLLSLTDKKSDKNPIVLIDSPGVVRGVGGAEMLMALAEVLDVDIIVILYRENTPIPLADEFTALQVPVLCLPASPEARAFTRLEKLERRLKLWEQFLADSSEETFLLNQFNILGTPPPLEAPEAWKGRQAALLDAAGGTERMGEVLRLEDGALSLRMVSKGKTTKPISLLIRDAGRNPRNPRNLWNPANPGIPGDQMDWLETIKRVNTRQTIRRYPVEITSTFISPKAGSAPVFSNLGSAWATLVGGVFGDPLVHVRLRRLKESLLFDLGDPVRLTARVAHQVSSVFLSHAHIDHINGLTWLLRSRFGPFGPCRIFGPLETISRIESFLDTITWDRIDDKGPLFEVYEIDGAYLRHTRLQPGRKRIDFREVPICDGVILTENSFTIKAAICDHNIPSIAYALVFKQEIKVRKDRLAKANLSPGRWLATLKECIYADTPEVEIKLPDKRTAKAGELAKDLTIILPGKKLTYAADMADTPDNRKKVIELARSAHTFFCETAFTIEDKEKAEATQHLTTLAAMHIAREAGVKRLVPFHFSKRYERNSQSVYDEILSAAGSVEILGHFN
jgi:ribonuclease BN (tRNA processing enzyme)/energy-coupling factor transporter ATP-binding protein EcfA2